MGKIGRNEPCPCGSKKKYKKCCLGKDNITWEPYEKKILPNKDPNLNDWVEKAIQNEDRTPKVAFLFARKYFVAARFIDLFEEKWIEGLLHEYGADRKLESYTEDQIFIIYAYLYQQWYVAHEARNGKLLDKALDYLESLNKLKIETGSEIHLAQDELTLAYMMASAMCGDPKAVNRAYNLHPLRHEFPLIKEKYLEAKGRAYAIHGDLNKAYDIWHDAIKKYPNNPSMLLGYATLLSKTDRKEEAIEIAYEVKNKFPDYHEIELTIGNLLSKAGKYSAAIKQYRKIIENVPNNWKAFEHISYLQLLNQNFDEAEQNFQIAMELLKKDKDLAFMDAIKKNEFSGLFSYAKKIAGDSSYSYDLNFIKKAYELRIGFADVGFSKMYTSKDLLEALDNEKSTDIDEIKYQLERHHKKDLSEIAVYLTKRLPSFYKLPEPAKNSLIDSENSFLDPTKSDYSISVIGGYAKAVEITLKTEVFDRFRSTFEQSGFEVTMTTEIKLEYQKKAKNFINYIKKNAHLELGSMILILRYCIGKTAENVDVICDFRDFILNNLKRPQILEKSFIDKLDEIREPRNPSVHSSTFDKDTAAKVRELSFNAINGII